MKYLKLALEYGTYILLALTLSYIALNHYHAYRFKASIAEIIQDLLDEGMDIRDVSYELSFPVPRRACGSGSWSYVESYEKDWSLELPPSKDEINSFWSSGSITLPFYPTFDHFFHVRSELMEGNRRCSTWRNRRRGRPPNAELLIVIHNYESEEIVARERYWWDVKGLRFVDPSHFQ